MAEAESDWCWCVGQLCQCSLLTLGDDSRSASDFCLVVVNGSDDSQWCVGLQLPRLSDVARCPFPTCRVALPLALPHFPSCLSIRHAS